MAISKKDAKASSRKAQDVVASVADGKLSRAKRKKLAKLRRKALQRSWCWYCDREFEDDKVLLSHQKAKHFRCPHCPRRLNTAGGLAVHIDQVHKLGTDRIANAIAGRDSFDVEIYGMEGIPAEDLKEWKLKKASEAGVDETAGPQAGRDLNKPKIDKTVISLEELKRQLGIHKDLMEGKITPSQAAQLLAGITPVAQPVLPPVPPPMSAPMGAPGMPPMMPGMLPPPGMPAPPPGMPMPPPGMPLPPPGMPLPPGMPAPPSASPMPPAGMPPPPGQLPPQAAGSSAAPTPAPAPAPSAAPVPFELKAGQVLVAGNPDTSPEERRAQQERYAVKGDASGGRPRAADLI